MRSQHRHIPRIAAIITTVFLTASGLMAEQKQLLFGDTFNRANSTNLNESATGQSGSLGVLNYATRTFTSEAAGPVVLDINNNTLRIDGPASEGTYGGLVYIDDHNFTDAAIVADGGFSITVDIAAYSTGGSGRYMSVGVGQTLAELEAQTGADAPSHVSDLLVAYRNTTDTLEIYKNGVLDATETVTGGLPNAPTTMRIEYSFANFNAGSTGTYEVFFDDDVTPFTSGSFTWSSTDENIISLASNLTNASRFDNLQVRAGSTSGDFTAPTPDPLTWASLPTADDSTTVSMTATTAYDDNGVEYFFENTSILDGSHDSGWQSGTSYTDTNLTAETTYAYTVMARDRSVNTNETTVTIAVLVTTPALDNTPPNPDPMTWASVPAAVNHSSISMTATTATDLNGVQYYFSNTTVIAGTHDSGWQNSPVYNDTGLDPETSYTYTVIARDNSPDGRNETGASSAESATTTAAPVYGRIAGVDFEKADNLAEWDSSPDDLNTNDLITVSTNWTVVTTDTSNPVKTVIKQDNGADTGSDFGFDGAAPVAPEVARAGKLNIQETGGPAAPPATTLTTTHFSWSITIPEGESLDLGQISFKWRQGTGAASNSRWGQFNTSLDDGGPGGTPLWTDDDPPSRDEDPNFNNEVIVDLSAAKYQGLTDTTVTFYWYSERTGSDIDTIILSGNTSSASPVDDLSIEVLGSEVGLGWYGEAGGSYNLQEKGNLVIGTWQTITNIAGANADILVIQDADKTTDFYRVKLAE